MRRLPVLLAALTFLAGCSAQDPEELDRLVKQDPNFKQMITSRDQMHHEIGLIKKDLLQKKQAMDTETDKLRNAYNAYSRLQNDKISKYESAIEAYRALMQREIDTAEAQLAAKETELGGYDKTLSSVRRMLKETNGIKLTGTEKQKWEERILMTSEKMRPLTEDIQELRAQLALKKRKLVYLS